MNWDYLNIKQAYPVLIFPKIRRGDATYIKSNTYFEYIKGEHCSKTDVSLQELNEWNEDNTLQQHLKEAEEDNDNSGIWSKTGMLNNAAAAALGKKLSNLNENQPVFNYIISFDETFANKNKLFGGRQVYDVFSQPFSKFIKTTKLNDINNLEWGFSFHNNTNNPHIHLFFFEKTPQLIDRSPKATEIFKFVDDENAWVSKDKLEKFKFNLAWSIENDFDWKKANNLRNFIVHNLGKDVNKKPLEWKNIYKKTNEIEVEDDEDKWDTALTLTNDLIINTINKKEAKDTYYNKLGKEEKEKVDELVNILFANNDDCKNGYKDYVDLLDKYENKFKNFKDTNFKNSSADIANFKEGKLKELKERLGNELIKQLRNKVSDLQYSSNPKLLLSFLSHREYVKKPNTLKYWFKKFDYLIYKQIINDIKARQLFKNKQWEAMQKLNNNTNEE